LREHDNAIKPQEQDDTTNEWQILSELKVSNLRHYIVGYQSISLIFQHVKQLSGTDMFRFIETLVSRYEITLVMGHFQESPIHCVAVPCPQFWVVARQRNGSIQIFPWFL